MILICAKTGDLSPLLPLTVQTATRLQIAISILEDGKFELERQKMKLMVDLFEQQSLTLMDLRQIGMSQLYFKNSADRTHYVMSLPSMKNAEALKPQLGTIIHIQPGDDWKTIKIDAEEK